MVKNPDTTAEGLRRNSAKTADEAETWNVAVTTDAVPGANRVCVGGVKVKPEIVGAVTVAVPKKPLAKGTPICTEPGWPGARFTGDVGDVTPWVVNGCTRLTYTLSTASVFPP